MSDASENSEKIGNLSARANISDKVDWSLVPGEVAYKHRRRMFSRLVPRLADDNDRATEIQRQEWLTYEPCGVQSCQRRRYDPECSH